MSKRRRFKRKTLGRLHMFFQKKPYTGFRNSVTQAQTSSCIHSVSNHEVTLTHYSNVTKKELHNTNNTLCEYN